MGHYLGSHLPTYLPWQFSWKSRGSCRRKQKQNQRRGRKLFEKLAEKDSYPGGFYDTNIEVALSVDSPTAEIRYTKDGSDPTESLTKYVNPIPIGKTIVLRARAFEEGYLPGKIATHTYAIFWDNLIAASAV